MHRVIILTENTIFKTNLKGHRNILNIFGGSQALLNRTRLTPLPTNAPRFGSAIQPPKSRRHDSPDRCGAFDLNIDAKNGRFFQRYI